MPDTLITVASLALMVLAAIGAGRAILRVIRVEDELPPIAWHAISFVIGMGSLGWLAFLFAFSGWLDEWPLILLCLGLSLGIFLTPIRVLHQETIFHPFNKWTWILIAGLAIALAFDALRAIVPPADADSLAYHFALPKEFLATGRLFFIPRAADGAVPLLQQMSYMVALGIGGERVMTLWTTLSGWSATGVLYVLARRSLSREWAAATALLFLTVPAVVYASNSGQVEIRSAAFVLVSALAILEARRSNFVMMSALAGLAAGFYAASKYPGLLFLPLGALAVTLQRRWFAHGVAFSLAAFLAASPFYLWHWWNTGDPFFPMLYGLIDYRPDVPWNAEIDSAFKNWTGVTEKAYPQNLFYAIAYPFLATMRPDVVLESGRTGFGPIALLLLPVAFVGAWLNRHRILKSQALILALLILGFYLAWHFFGASQRVRHFLPMYPLLLLCIIPPSIATLVALPTWRQPIALAVVSTIIFQISVSAVFTLGSARYLLSNETRDAFHRRSIPSYDIAQQANSSLPPNAILLHDYRQLNYLLSIPYFFANPLFQAEIDLRNEARDLVVFWNQLTEHNITHWIVVPNVTTAGGAPYLAAQLLNQGCIEEMFSGTATAFPSRTISTVTAAPFPFKIFRLVPRNCPLASGQNMSPSR